MPSQPEKKAESAHINKHYRPRHFPYLYPIVLKTIRITGSVAIIKIKPLFSKHTFFKGRSIHLRQRGSDAPRRFVLQNSALHPIGRKRRRYQQAAFATRRPFFPQHRSFRRKLANLGHVLSNRSGACRTNDSRDGQALRRGFSRVTRQPSASYYQIRFTATTSHRPPKKHGSCPNKRKPK